MPSFSWELAKTIPLSVNTQLDIFTPYPEHWRKWEIASCEEWTSGHDWRVCIYRDELGPQLDVFCMNCPMMVHDLIDDAYDLLYGTLDDVVIDNGRFNYTEDKTFKVNVKLHVEKYTSMDFIGPEYDVWIEVTKREQP